MWKLYSIVLSLLLFGVQTECSVQSKGYCAMVGNCGKKSFFGSSLPCVANVEAKEPSEDSLVLLKELCGKEFSVEKVCCSTEQLVNMKEQIKRAEPLIASCPACKKNFYDFFCEFTCSPDQSLFVDVTKTGKAIDTGAEIVTELTQYVDPTYAKDFFDSCKEVKFSATNGYTMDLIGGGATNFEAFLKFLGDEKPLLGGSPFQINHRFALKQDEIEDGFELVNGSMKRCDDADYKCACSDCSKSCPTLSPFKDFKDKCTIGKLPCFSFTVLMIWICLILLLGGFHVYLARSKRHHSEGNFWELSTHLELKKSYSLLEKTQSIFLSKVQIVFERLGYICAKFPTITIGISVFTAILLSLGLFKLSFETDPVHLWVSPNEPSLKEKEYFESKFGEFYRIEQIIISSPDKPILNWENIEWWFSKEKELQNLNGLPLSDFCFKPLGDACIIESFTQYFDGDLNGINEKNWKDKISSCANSPVNCLPEFQQPLKPNLLFDNENVLESNAIIVTLLLNSNSSDSDYTSKAIEFEHAIKDWVFDLKQQTDLIIDFSTESSLTEELNKSTNTDVKIIVISYLLMFVYASLALGGKVPKSLSDLLSTRLYLGLGGIFIILFSVTSSMGVFSLLGLKSTLIIAEVIPFLVLAIGIDNIFLIVHQVNRISAAFPEEIVETRISTSLGKIGPSCLTSGVLQVSMFILATRVEMPAVKNFAYYSAGAIVMNFVLQMTAFVALLSLDQRRIENPGVGIISLLRGDYPIQLPENELNTDAIVGSVDENPFTKLLTDKYLPYILKKSNSRKLLMFFTCWMGLSLGLLPYIDFGLDQRIALPKDSYLVDYFSSVYEHLNTGPPVYFVVKDLNVTERTAQQNLCGKFSSCDEFSVANILEQEFARHEKSMIADPTSNWLDDFFNWLNPSLDQCCRLKKKSLLEKEFCSARTPERLCVPCYQDHEPPFSTTMEGLPTGEEFMTFFKQWIEEPSEPCPLGGKAPYSNAISFTPESIEASYLRTSHVPLRSQEDFINAYKNSLRIVQEIKEKHPKLDVFAFSPFYVFFVQYQSIIKLSFTLMAVAAAIICFFSLVLLGSFRATAILLVTVFSILIDIGGVLALWSVSLNAISLVNIITCLGLAVEFTVHITRAYLVAPTTLTESDMHFLFPSFTPDSARTAESNRRLTKVFNALSSVGSSVLGGITITKVIGISVLAFTRSKIFEIYYFRMWAALIVIAAVHALCLLPILLSLFGDVDSPQSNPDSRAVPKNHPTSLVQGQRRYGNDSDDD